MAAVAFAPDGSTTSPASAPLLVIGAGTTGLTLACELARHGVPIRIVDRLAEVNPHCRATTLHSRTLEIFHDLGIAEAVTAEAPPIRALNHYVEGRRVSRDELGHVDSPYPYSLSLEQSRTEAILEALLERLGVRVERRTELLAISEGPDAVRATLRGPGGREEVVDAPWLIGCDGAHSTVRHQTHQAFPGSEDSHQYAIADVVLDGPIAQDEAHVFLTDGGVLYMFPLPRGRVLLAAEVAAHHDGATETPALEEIQSLVGERGPAGTRVSDPRWLSYFRIHYRLARHYRHGRRVFLAGDAVHVHSPVGGHGMNTGIQDAYNLGWKLALVARGLAAPALLETYEAERRAIAEDVVKWTRAVTERSEAFAGMSPARRERLYVNVTVPDAEARRIARHAEELDLDYRRSAICAEHRPRGRPSGLHAGTQALDAGPLQCGDRRFTLFDLLRGPRHALLLFPGPRAGGAAWHRLAALSASLGRSHGNVIDVHVVG